MFRFWWFGLSSGLGFGGFGFVVGFDFGGFSFLVGGGLGFDFAVAKVVVANGVVSGGRRKIQREREEKIKMNKK